MLYGTRVALHHLATSPWEMYLNVCDSDGVLNPHRRVSNGVFYLVRGCGWRNPGGRGGGTDSVQPLPRMRRPGPLSVLRLVAVEMERWILRQSGYDMSRAAKSGCAPPRVTLRPRLPSGMA